MNETKLLFFLIIEMECKRYLGLTVHSEEENVLIPPHIQFIHKQKVSERYISKLLSGFFFIHNFVTAFSTT